MTNPAELGNLKSPAFQRRLGNALASGVMSYFEERAPEGTLVTWRKANPDGVGPEDVDRMAAELMKTVPR